MTPSPDTRHSDDATLDEELNAAARAILMTVVLILAIPVGALAVLFWALAS